LALVGTIVGSAITYLTTRSTQNWKQAKSDIKILTEQLKAFHKLEELYSELVSELDESRGAAITVKKKMRDDVELLPDYERPRITPGRIKQTKIKWND
jgi:hypothetical protein